MLTITVPTPDPSRLAPSDPAAAPAWLRKVGPTGWCATQWLHDQAQGLEAGDQIFVDLDDLRTLLGVKRSVLHNGLSRLSRFRVTYYDLARGVMIGDGTLPAASGDPIPVHVHRLGGDT